MACWVFRVLHMLLIVAAQVDTVDTVDAVLEVAAVVAALAVALDASHEVLVVREKKVIYYRRVYCYRKLMSLIGDKEHSEEGGDGEEENDESGAPRENATRGRFRGRFRGGGYRPRYFNRPRRNTDGEETTGDKSQADGEPHEVCILSNIIGHF